MPKSGTLIFFLCLFAFPQGKAADLSLTKETEPVAPSSEPLDVLREGSTMALVGSRERRRDSRWGVLVDYSFLDTWLPSKYGVTVVLPPGENDSAWEFEYLKGSLSFPFFIRDLGRMTEEKYSVSRRLYAGRNSFHFLYGLTYYDFTARLGNRFLETVIGSASAVDIARVKTLGVTLGFGNRWHLPKNWILSVDWIDVFLPVAVLESKAPFLSASSDPDRRDDLDEVLGLIEKIPSLTLGKIAIGYHF